MKPKPRELIAWKGLSASYGDRVVFRALEGSVDPNSILSIVGPSGCGKTTLLLVLSGLLKPEAGELSVDPSLSNSASFYVAQHDALLPWRSLRANLGLGWELSRGRPPSTSEVEKWANVFNALDFLEKHVHELSGGMRKRICLARAFCANPSVVLLDEPFNNLDFRDRQRVENFLRRWVAEDRRGVLCVTHDIEQAVAIGDRVGCFTNGLGSSNDDRARFDVMLVPDTLRERSPSERRAHPEFHVIVEKVERMFDHG